MTVAQLIELLHTFPQDLEVAYACYSEYTLLEPQQIGTLVAQPARPDGWIGFKRPDKPKQTYLCFPGN